MLKATLLKQIVGAVLGLSLASSGLAYAGVDAAPNPVQEVIDVASSNDDGDVEAQNGEENGDENGEDGETPAHAQEKQDAAKAYTDAVRAWTECVRANAQAQGDDETRVEGEFDPREGCDERPNPHDFGLTGPPEHAAEQGQTNSTEGQQRGEDARSQNQPSDTPDEGDDENSAEGKPDDAPDGKPDEAPDGKPDDTPDGPPQGVPGR